ncbi:MAG: acetoin utilization protein AcuC, partial [Thermodesulfovibrionales bacterium]
MSSALIYSPLYRAFDYGPSHPLRMARLAVAHELMGACGLLSIPRTRYVDARMATDEELLLVHRREYLVVLKDVNEGRSVPWAGRFGLGPGDNPVFSGLLDWSRLVTGASLQAAALVESGEVQVAF